MAKKKKKPSIVTLWIAFIIAIVSYATGQSWMEKETSPTDTQKETVQQADAPLMEIPVMDAKKQGQVLYRTGYTLSYDPKTKTPQWVAWELTKKETNGQEERSDKFQPDPDVTGAQVVTTDYSNTGYDRGHMAPAADMKWSKKAMQESFYMSNICPQNHHLNTADWGELEKKSRQWARRYGKVHIVCGPLYLGKRNEYIGKNRVKVPDAFFKVVLINHAKKQVALGFLFDNESGERPLTAYLTSVDKIEKMTGMDFFSALPDELENRLEKEIPEELP